MSEATTISSMLKAVADGPAWHGPSILELVEGMTADQARAKPLPDAHSAWEVLLHISAWQDYTLSVLAGGDAHPLDGDADWPPVPQSPSEAAWETTRRGFEGGVRELRESIRHLDESRLHATVPGRDFPLKVLLHGIMHHNVYHCGQLALLRSARLSGGVT